MACNDDGYKDEPTLPSGLVALNQEGQGQTGSDRARLIGVAGPVATRKFPVGEVVTIGRSSRADIAIEDLKLSRVHLRIKRTEAGSYWLEDLGSKNGTFVNRARVDHCDLKFGDEIRVGDTVLLFTHHNPVEDKLLQKERMELLGRIGAGVAHDFNNLLSAAMASIDYLTGLSPARNLGDADVSSCLGEIERALKRAAELSSRLLGLSRQQGYVHDRLDLAALAREVVDLLRHTLPRSIHIRLNVTSAEVMGDWTQLHQVIMSLCVNARDSMGSGGGTLTVGVQRRPAPAGEVQKVELVVSDTGPGMDEATRKRAFDPFFTTKSSEGGTGLDLSNVLEIVKYHGGQVDLVTALGQGTTVTVLLPAAPIEDGRRVSDTLQDLPNVGARPSANEAHLRILIVDDNGAVRRSLSRLLRVKGYEVLSAVDGAEAVRVFERERPDLVLMDLDMPVLPGPDAYRRIKELDPRARVIIMSGHSIARLEANHPWPDEGPTLLQKPSSKEAIEAAISAALMR